jgi:hypothetical protein
MNLIEIATRILSPTFHLQIQATLRQGFPFQEFEMKIVPVSLNYLKASRPFSNLRVWTPSHLNLEVEVG